MSAVNLDMEGLPIDSAMQLATEVVHERTASEPSFAGLWTDLQAREIHHAFAGATAAHIAQNLQTQVPPVVRLRAHQFEHPLAELEALHQAVSLYMEQEGLWPQYVVDSGVQVRANLVQVNLKDTTPPEIAEAFRARFAGAPLQIDLTTSRWNTQ